jgi:hypothetical protein
LALYPEPIANCFVECASAKADSFAPAGALLHGTRLRAKRREMLTSQAAALIDDHTF